MAQISSLSLSLIPTPIVSATPLIVSPTFAFPRRQAVPTYYPIAPDVPNQPSPTQAPSPIFKFNFLGVNPTTSYPTQSGCPTMIGAPASPSAIYNSFGYLDGSYDFSGAKSACEECSLKLADITILDAPMLQTSFFDQTGWIASWNTDSYNGVPLLFYPGLEVASPDPNTNAAALCFDDMVNELA